MRVFNHERAKQLIDERGLKRRWIAGKLGLVHASLNQYLIGRARPADERVTDLARILGVNASELFTETGRKARTA